MSSEPGSDKKTASEVEAAIAEMERLTGATFEQEEPAAGFKPLGEEIKWYIRCPYIDQVEKMYHANAVWREADGSLHVRSMSLGDYLGWIEREYGEEGVIRAMKSISDFSHNGVREKIGGMFPLIRSRLRKYERDCAKASQRRNVLLLLSADASKENVSVFLESKIDAKTMSRGKALEWIDLAVGAMKETISGIDSTR